MQIIIEPFAASNAKGSPGKKTHVTKIEIDHNLFI